MQACDFVGCVNFIQQTKQLMNCILDPSILIVLQKLQDFAGLRTLLYYKQLFGNLTNKGLKLINIQIDNLSQ